MPLKKTASEYLKEAIRDLMAHKPVDDITVAELCEITGISRTTFYKRYVDKQALVEQVFLDEIANVFFYADGPMAERETGILKRIDANRQFYENALRSPEFVDAWMKHAYASDLEYLQKLLADDMKTGQISRGVMLNCTYLITQSLANTTLDWIRRRPTCTPEEYATTIASYCRGGVETLIERKLPEF